MTPDRDAMKAAIRSKVIELAAVLGVDASGIGDDEIIPAMGFLDSAAILDLIWWYETAYRLALTQDEITIDNLGTIEAMADFAIRRAATGISPS